MGDDGIGRYRRVRRLARGGMAELVLARATDTSELVVIKRILPALEADADFRRLFEKEIEVARRMQHRNIARMIDAGTSDGAPYIVFEYVRGCDLRRLLAHEVKNHAAMPIDVAVAIATSITDALQYAHERAGILHRDIDPTNVLLALDGTVKLVDFGIARAIAITRTTRASWFKGKAGYVAPEQCLGEHVDARTDVFAVGVLLYEMTTGHRLFHGATEYETTNLVLRGEYVRPRAIVRAYPRPLEAIVCRALATRPEDRFASARALGAALRRFAKDRPSCNATKRLARSVQEVTGETPSSRARPFAMGLAIGAPAAAIAVLMAFGGVRPNAPAPIVNDRPPPASTPIPAAPLRAPAPRRSDAPHPARAEPALEVTPSIADPNPPVASAPERPARRRPRREASADASPVERDPADEDVRTSPEPVVVVPAPPPRVTERPSLFPPSRTKPWDQLRAGDTSVAEP